MQSDTLFTRLLRHDAAGGVALMLAAALAMIVANSALSAAYLGLFATKFSVLLDGAGISKPLILWVNDGLMAIFFFLIGLELKREILEGKLRNPRDVILPGVAAMGGMAVPALIYIAVNWNSPDTLRGWAIPAATDIAFAVGVLALLGKRAPASNSDQTDSTALDQLEAGGKARAIVVFIDRLRLDGRTLRYGNRPYRARGSVQGPFRQSPRRRPAG